MSQSLGALCSEQNRVVIKAMGIGEAGDVALKRASQGKEWSIEILPAFIDDLKSTQRNLADVDLLLLAIDADSKENVGSTCALIDVAKSEKILVFSVALFSSESQKDSSEALARLEAKTDALLIVPKTSGEHESESDAFADTLRVLRSCLKLMLETEMDICVDFSDLKELLTNTGRAFLGIGLGKGEESAVLAAREALNKPVTGRLPSKFTKVIVCLETVDSATIFEIQKAVEVIARACAEDAQILWGHAANAGMGNTSRVVVLAA